jgi:hypothetical protein
MAKITKVLSEESWMSSARSSRQLGRSVLAVLAGMAVAIVLTLLTDLVLHKLQVFPPYGERASDRSLMLATAYRTVYGIAAAYLTAYLAPYRPLAHAMVGGAIGFIASIAGAIATWNAGPAYGPHWYPVALIILALPQSWLGGWLRLRQLTSPSA